MPDINKEILKGYIDASKDKLDSFIFRMSFLRKQESRKRAWRLQVIEKENQP